MTVVRTLTTNLDFNVDFKAINQFTKGIKDFKLNFALGSIAAADFARRVVGAINSVTTLITDTEDLADTTGIAFDKLYNLTQLATRSGVERNAFQNLLVNFNKQILDAEYRTGALFDFMAQQGGVVIKDEQGNLLGTLEVLQQVVDQLNKVENAQQRINFIENLFSGGNGAALNRFFTTTGKNVLDIEESFLSMGATLKEYTTFSRQFKADMREIFAQFDITIQNFVVKFSPVILAITTALEKLITLYNTFSKGVDKVVEKSAEGVKSVLGVAGRSLLMDTDLSDIYDPRDRYGPPVNVQNNIDINVPEGTTAEQTKVISEAAKEAFDTSIAYYMRLLMIGNPQVE